MSSNIKRIARCPTCNKPIQWSPDNHYRPFCSERCKLIDLGAWFEESYQLGSDESPDHAIDIPDNLTGSD